MSEIDYKIIYKKAGILWDKMPWRKILAFSFCLILSVVFWFIQVYRQTFTTTYNVHIKYTHIPDSIIFDQELPSSVEITIRDNGYTLFKYFLSKRNDTISVNVNNILRQSSRNTAQAVTLKQLVKSYLLPSTELLRYSPENISLAHTLLQNKMLPVVFDGQILLASGYLLNGDIQIYPDSVKVYGSENALNDLHYAYTVSDTVKDLKTEIPLTYPIKKVPNVRFDPDEIMVHVPVDKYTQKTVSVPISCINIPDGLNIKFFPSSVNVSFEVGLSKYRYIYNNDFLIQFDYDELKGLKDVSVPVRIVSSPDYIKILSISPSDVEFIFEEK